MPGVRLTSIDLSSAVEANQRNFPQDSRHRVVQCDVARAPFASGTFEVVVCLGVIQHTPDPERTIESLYRLLQPGGWLIIDHYAPSLGYWTKFSTLALRPFVKRLPPSARMRVCELLVSTFFPIHRLLRKSTAAQLALSRISPLLTYFDKYPELSDQLQRELALLDTHDALTDWYKHVRTPAMLAATLKTLGADSIEAWTGGNGAEVRCRRP
jgi:SAM-dependent methyltransferase